MQNQLAAKAFLVFTGTELVRGKLNSYTPLLCAELAKLGIEVTGETTLPDDETAVCAAIKTAFTTADMVLVTGGLGPTFDDVSREAAAKALGRKLVLDPKLLAALRSRFKKLNRPMPPTNERQAMRLEGAKSLPNPAGTAPGQMLEFIAGGKRKLLALQPGPLVEWQPIFTKHIQPALKKFFALRQTAGIDIRIGDTAESAAGEMLAPVRAKFPQAEFTILASPGTVRFIALPRGSKNPAGDAAAMRRMCRNILGDRIFAESDMPLEAAVGAVLKNKGWTLATAESCTGGLVAHMITEVAGSSAYFLGGVVAYSNPAKIKFLGVKKTTLEKYGAVSAQTALEMARGARSAFGADCGLATTGIAGPGGGSAQKPVGLVYIAAAFADGSEQVIERRFSSTRGQNKTYAAATALNHLRKAILHKKAAPYK